MTRAKFTEKHNNERKERMKNKTIVKVIAIMAAMTALTATAFAVSAQDTEATKPEIFSQNVYYSDKFSLMYAVDASTVTGDTVTLTVTGGDTEWSQTIAATAENQQTIKNKAAYVFITEGVGPQDFATQYTVTATSGDATSEAKRYSIAEYLGEQLYKNGYATPGKDEIRKEFYLSTLEFAANMGKVLNIDTNPNNNVDHLVTDYYYVYTDLGTIDGAYSAGVYLETDSITFTPADATKKYQVSLLDANGNVTSSEVITDGTFTVSGNAVIEVKAYERGEGKYWNDRTALLGKPVARDFGTDGASLNGFSSASVSTGSVVDSAATMTKTVEQWTQAYFYYSGISDSSLSDENTDLTKVSCKIYEFDYKMSDMFTGTSDGRPLFRLDGGDYIKAYRNSDGTTLSLGAKDTAVITPGKWCNIRLEFYNVGGVKYVQIYVDDTYGYTMTLTDTANTYNNRIYFYLDNAMPINSTVCVDNFIIGLSDNAYEAK